MGEKTNSFFINTILTVLLIGILFLPVASMGLLGVQKGLGVDQVLSAQDEYVEEEDLDSVEVLNPMMVIPETSPSISVEMSE